MPDGDDTPVRTRFQSTPDYLNRENRDTQDKHSFPALFQSTPDYLNRENATLPSRSYFLRRVSIHSRLFKPGELICLRPAIADSDRFNPLPII